MKIASDGGPQFTSSEFKSFLKTWEIHHRLSSAEYPQSNGRAKLAVKTAKQTIIDNTLCGSLDTDKAARAILEYRNTPIQSLGLSPAQILFHRQLRDHIPNHPTNLRLHMKWLIATKQRENLANLSMETPNQQKENPRNLPTIPIGTRVAIQDQRGRNNFRKWNRTSVIVEILPFRQYQAKMDGSGRLSLRNRRFIKPSPSPTKLTPRSDDAPHSNDAPRLDSAPIRNSMTRRNSTPNCSNNTPHPNYVPQTHCMLQKLQNFNTPGLKE